MRHIPVLLQEVIRVEDQLQAMNVKSIAVVTVLVLRQNLIRGFQQVLILFK